MPSAPKPPVGKPPPKPGGKAEPEDLAEVERALSVLDGRHPEFVRSQREAKRAADERNKVARAENEAETRLAFKRKMVVGLVAAGAVALAVVIGTACSRVRGMNEELDRLSARYVAAGFTVAASSSLWSSARIETQLAPGCAIAFASKEGGPAELRVQHGPAMIEGKGTIGWCACNDEIAVLSLAREGEGGSGLRILHAEGHVVGGSREFAASAVRPDTLGLGGDDCADADLDAWLTEKRYPPISAAAPWFDPARSPLGASGFAVVGAAPQGNRFAVVDAKGGRCYVAFGAKEGDRLAVRVTGPEHGVAQAAGPVAWCDSRATPYTVWREGTGDVTVVAAPAERVGGLLGTIEAATRAGVEPRGTWLRADDQGYNARAILKASGLADATTIVPEATPPVEMPNARFVAISISEEARVEPETVADVLFFCSPGFDTHAPETVCVETGALKWRRAGWRPAGTAAASFPFWMQLFESVQDPDVLKLEISLLGLARRLASQGFEPTVLEGVKELRNGDIEVLGRADEDAVVAIGLFSRAPWVTTYTDGVAWGLADEPRVVALEPGSTVTLTARPARSLPSPEGAEKGASGRRTVVFRRAAKR